MTDTQDTTMSTLQVDNATEKVADVIEQAAENAEAVGTPIDEIRKSLLAEHMQALVNKMYIGKVQPSAETAKQPRRLQDRSRY